MKREINTQVAQWRNSDDNNPAGPLFVSGEFAEADITGQGFTFTAQCGTACSGSATRQCC